MRANFVFLNSIDTAEETQTWGVVVDVDDFTVTEHGYVNFRGELNGLRVPLSNIRYWQVEQ